MKSFRDLCLFCVGCLCFLTANMGSAYQEIYVPAGEKYHTNCYYFVEQYTGSIHGSSFYEMIKVDGGYVPSRFTEEVTMLRRESKDDGAILRHMIDTRQIRLLERSDIDSARKAQEYGYGSLVGEVFPLDDLVEEGIFDLATHRFPRIIIAHCDVPGAGLCWFLYAGEPIRAGEVITRTTGYGTPDRCQAGEAHVLYATKDIPAFQLILSENEGMYLGKVVQAWGGVAPNYNARYGGRVLGAPVVTSVITPVVATTTSSSTGAKVVAPVATPVVASATTTTTTSSSTNAKVVNVSDNITNTSGNIFFIVHDAKRNLWVGMELVTPSNVVWWQKRLAYEVYLHFKLQEEYSELLKHGSYTHVHALQEDAGKIMSPFYEDISRNGEFMQQFNVHKSWDLHKLGSGFLFERITGYAFDNDLMNAFRGFAYNLDHYTEGGEATWVAYVSSKPTHGPLYLEKDFNVASPDIKMTVTVKVSNVFYCPLGIFRSPIAKDSDWKNKVPDVKNLSMFFHSRIAHIVKQFIKPSVEWAEVRPLSSMMNIFNSSGVPYTVSCGYGVFNRPYVTIMNDGFGLVDPQSNTIYKISGKHWFSTSPFLGGLNDVEFFRQYPFVTIGCDDLSSYHKE